MAKDKGFQDRVRYVQDLRDAVANQPAEQDEMDTVLIRLGLSLEEIRGNTFNVVCGLVGLVIGGAIRAGCNATQSAEFVLSGRLPPALQPGCQMERLRAFTLQELATLGGETDQILEFLVDTACTTFVGAGIVR